MIVNFIHAYMNSYILEFVISKPDAITKDPKYNDLLQFILLWNTVNGQLVVIVVIENTWIVLYLREIIPCGWKRARWLASKH